MAMDVRNLAALFATVGVGMLAGTMLGTGLAALTAKGLPEAAWTLRFQLEDRLFSKAMPPLMLGTLLVLLIACALARGASRPLLAVSAGLMILVLVITIGFEVPLNKQIQSWTPGSAPPIWLRVRDLWLERHVLRTIASILAFLSALLALMTKGN